jgi:hypothetical protein
VLQIGQTKRSNIATVLSMGAQVMAKIGISSSELVWVFHQRLEAFDDCPPEVPIAIVPAPDVGWMALMSAKSRTQNPHWARRVEAIQKQLREIYVLRD